METEQQHTPQTPNSSNSNNTGMAMLCYIGILVLVPLLTDAKNDPFVKFHIKQGLVLLVVWILGSALFWIPVVGWLLWIVVAILTIIGIMNAASGKEKELPIIGQFGSQFHF